MSQTPPFAPKLNHVYEIDPLETWPAARHQFESASVDAVNAAITSGRPLLIRGEPGIGKSQLARAAAHVLEVPFLPFVVDERTERDDLFYSYDAVARLAQAQVSALTAAAEKNGDWKTQLAEENFLRPDVMWWAFNWESARGHAQTISRYGRDCPEPQRPKTWTPISQRRCGPVVLIDEIDKADPSVPNGLLECLGNHKFRIAQLGKSIGLAQGAPPPLVIITTNEDREVPAPFLRRCLVLHMNFPKYDQDHREVREFLIQQRARTHWTVEEISDDVCGEVVHHLLKSRKEAPHHTRAKPGAAEFLDILRVMVKLCPPGDSAAQRAALTKISQFALKKHAEDTR